MFQTDSNRVSAATVASTAIAAAQWAVTQVTLLYIYFYIYMCVYMYIHMDVLLMVIKH